MSQLLLIMKSVNLIRRVAGSIEGREDQSDLGKSFTRIFSYEYDENNYEFDEYDQLLMLKMMRVQICAVTVYTNDEVV